MGSCVCFQSAGVTAKAGFAFDREVAKVLVKLIQRFCSLRVPIKMKVGPDLVWTAALSRPVLGCLFYTLQKVITAHHALLLSDLICPAMRAAFSVRTVRTASTHLHSQSPALAKIGRGRLVA